MMMWWCDVMIPDAWVNGVDIHGRYLINEDSDSYDDDNDKSDSNNDDYDYNDKPSNAISTSIAYALPYSLQCELSIIAR